MFCRRTEWRTTQLGHNNQNEQLVRFKKFDASHFYTEKGGG